jgi:hypothetical protein
MPGSGVLVGTMSFFSHYAPIPPFDMKPMNRLNLLLFMLLALNTTGFAQDGSQLTLDTLTGARNGLVMEDGSVVLALAGENKTVFWIADPDGTPQTCFSAQPEMPYGGFVMTPRPGGGFYTFGQSALAIHDLNFAPDDDTLIVTVKLCGFTSTGVMDVCRTFTIEKTGSIDVWWNVGLDMEADENGVYMSVNDGINSRSSVWLFKTSFSGELAWCKEYRVGLTSFSSIDYSYKVAPSGDGGLFFARQNYQASGSNILIARIGPAGEMVWAKDYEYVTPFCVVHLLDLVLSTAGDPIALGGMLAGGGPYGYLLSPSADGVSVEGHFYKMPESAEPDLGSGCVLPDGSMVVTTIANYDGPLRIQLLRIGPDLEVVDHALTDVVVHDQTDYSLYPTMIGSSGDQAVVIGSLRSEDQIFGTTSYQATVWKLDLSDPEGCMLADSVVVHYPIPDDLLITTSVTPTVENIVTPIVTDEPLITVAEPLLATTDLCELLVGTPELMQERGLITAYPNPTEGGSIVNIQCERAVRFALFSATGAVVRNIPVALGSEKATFSCPGLASGLYSVVAFGKDGQRLATTKVEVQ